MKKMIETYRQILDTANVFVTEDDCISLKEAKQDGTVKHIALTIKGKRLVIPTATQMRNPDWDERVAFHPLSENTGRGESEVMERLRALFNARLNAVFPLVLLRLLEIGASPKEHEKLNPEQGEFLSHVKNADKDTLADFKSICVKTPANQPSKAFISLFLRRSAQLDGRSYFRGGVVTFPFYTELTKGEPKIAGVALRKKDRATLKSLVDYVLPHQGDAHFYSRGSDSRIAPSIDAVMKAMLALAGPLNDVIERFEGLIPQELRIPTDWAETFENLEPLLPEVRELPMLRGNEGNHPEALTKAGASAPTAAQTPFAASPAPASVPAHPGAGIPGMGAVAPHQPVQQYPTQQYPTHPQAAPPYPAQSSGVGGMTNIDALMRGNPSFGGFPPQQQMMPMGSQRATINNPVSTPGWGAPQRTWGYPQQQQQQNGWGQAFQPQV